MLIYKGLKVLLQALINEKYLVEVDRGKKECKLLVDGQEIVLNFSPKLFAKLS